MLNLETNTPEEIKAFREEIKRHPELYKKLKGLDTFSDIVTEAASHVGLNLIGTFTTGEARIIISRIVELLQKKRQPIILR